MTVVVRSALTGPDSSRVLICQHTEIASRRYTWYLTQSLYTNIRQISRALNLKS